MSRELAPRLPTTIARDLTAPDPPDLAIQLVTIDDSGFPHSALLTFYEFVFLEGELYVAVAAKSRSASFLMVRGLAELVFISTEGTFYLKVDAVHVTKLGHLAVFKLVIRSTLSDSPPPEERGTVLASGIRFEMNDSSRSSRSNLKRKLSEMISGQK